MPVECFGDSGGVFVSYDDGKVFCFGMLQEIIQQIGGGFAGSNDQDASGHSGMDEVWITAYEGIKMLHLQKNKSPEL
jgi:hypothetical protein